jgi:hypothetical protein
MEFSNENLELEKYNYMVNGEDDESSHVNPVKYFSTKLLTEFFKHVDTAFFIIVDDTNRKRSAEVN